jgi:NADH-quinone oxidoreductase subunit N
MAFEVAQLQALAPEIFLATAACAVLLIDIFIRERYRLTTYALALVSLLVTAALTIWSGGDSTEIVLSGTYIRDPMSDALKVATCIIALMGFVYAKDYLRDRGLLKGEYFVMGLFAVLGMLVMISANGFLTLYLGLELLSLCLFALVAFDRESTRGAEAAMKFFVLGALSSGLLLYGISMVYGITGALDFPGVAQALQQSDAATNTALVFGLVFLVIGLAFKFGAVPFHMWVPDVYHGAPAPVTLFLGSAPKIAAFALAIRMLVEGLGPLEGGWEGWQGMLIILAVLSMALGNVAAIAQSNVKRMLAYSTIGHMGFIFLGLITLNGEGYAAAMFYAIVYALMAAGGFGLLAMLSRRGFEAQELDDLKGLNERSPWLAGMMLLIMFSMAGVPPTVGFFAKLFILEAVISVGMTWLALVAVFFSIIAAFYYLKVVKVMYFDKPLDQAPVTASMDAQIVMSANGVAVLLLGLFPAGLLAACQAAFGV